MKIVFALQIEELEGILHHVLTISIIHFLNREIALTINNTYVNNFFNLDHIQKYNPFLRLSFPS
jgi:hypothetical protein